jgi:restriction endonuclease Mrr
MADGSDHSMAELRDRIASDLKLTRDDLTGKLPSGRQTTFARRLNGVCSG